MPRIVRPSSVGSAGASPSVARAKVGATTHYQIPGVVINAVTVEAPSNNVLYFHTITVSKGVTCDQIACEVTTAQAANFRIGLYACDLDGQPSGAPLMDSGSISAAATGVKTYTPAAAVVLGPGNYLTAFVTDGSTLQLRAMRGSSFAGGALLASTLGANPNFRKRVVFNYAALPTGTTWDTLVASQGGEHYYVVLRLSAVT